MYNGVYREYRKRKGREEIMENTSTNRPEKVYRRMQQQEKFIEAVARVADEENINENLIKEIDDKFGRFEDLGLEKTVEKMSEAGWLEKNLEIVEKRFVYSVKAVIDAADGQVVNLENVFYGLGQEQEIEYEGKPVRFVYDAIRDMLLDGGKTEEINQIINEEYDEIVWSRVRPTTKKYWDDLGIDFTKYYLKLRQSFILGMLEKTDVKFEKLDDTVCQLSRR